VQCIDKLILLIDDTLGADTLEYITNHSQLPIIVASADKIPNLLRVSPKMPSLKVIVSMDDIPQWKESVTAKTPPNSIPSSSVLIREWAAERGIKLLTFKEVEAIGAKNQRKHIPPKVINSSQDTNEILRIF
jgi:long-chain acyl-CoA synthetase